MGTLKPYITTVTNTSKVKSLVYIINNSLAFKYFANRETVGFVPTERGRLGLISVLLE